MKLLVTIKGGTSLGKGKRRYKDELIICEREGSIVEVKDGELLIRADVTGIDKVFYEVQGNKVTVSNRFKDFIKNGVNEEFMEIQKLKGYVPYPFTLLKNVMKAPPGLITRLRLNKKGEIERSYRKSEELDIFSKKGTFNKRMFRKTFTKLLHDNAKGYDELTSSFSGGFDSLFLTIIFEKRISIIMHFSEDKKIDIPYYKKNLPGKKWIIASNEEQFSNVDEKKYFEFSDEPCCDPSGFAEYLMIKKISKKTKNNPLMNGQSCDAIFANGRKYFQEYFSSKLPKFLKNRGRFNHKSWFMKKLFMYTTNTKRRFEYIYVGGYNFSKPIQKEINRIYEIYINNIKNDTTNQLAAITMMLKYSVYELEKIKTAAKSFNKPYHIPFMSKKVIRYAFNIPSKYKIGFKTGKKVLIKGYNEISKMKFISRDFIPQKLKERFIDKKMKESDYREYYINKWIKYNMK